MTDEVVEENLSHWKEIHCRNTFVQMKLLLQFLVV